jgi:hypothetical protein
MKLYSYIVVHDYGFAPNPFHHICTLAVCTPNHMGIKATAGDWIAGFDEVRRGHNLIYAMLVNEVLHFNEYHADARFKAKIPRYSSDWRHACGDNLYFQTESGAWDRVASPFHNDIELFAKDVKHPYVFIASRYYYFGRLVVPTPRQFRSLVHARQGCKSNHDPATVREFVKWLERSYVPGMSAEPRDADETQADLQSEAPRSCSGG